MSANLLDYLTVIIFFGFLGNATAKCTGLTCSENQMGLSPMTISVLSAAEMQFIIEKESELAEFGQTMELLTYRITDQNILKSLERHEPTDVDEYIGDDMWVLKEMDSDKKMLTSGLMEVHLLYEDMKALNFESETEPVARGSFCVVNVKLLNYLHPQMLDSRTNQTKYPDSDGNIITGMEEEVLFLCPNSIFEFFDREGIYLKCLGRNKFHFGDFVMDFRDIKCKSWKMPEYKSTGLEDYFDSEKTWKKAEEFKYFFNDTIYYSIIYDKSDTYEKIYSRSIVSKSINGGQLIDGNKRVKFIEQPENTSIDPEVPEFYEKQDITLQQQLQGTNSDICIEDNPLVAVQLVHPISMVYESLALITFSSINYSPQWKSIANNNWDTINRHVNKMASYLQKDLTVITGVYEDYKIRNKDDTNDKSLYLNYRLDKTKSIKEMPIKLYFYKVVVEPQEKLGVVFITVNNPYIKHFPLYELCREPKFPRLISKLGCSWDPKYSHHGYSYTCDVDDFFETSKHYLRDEITFELDILPVQIEYEIDN